MVGGGSVVKVVPRLPEKLRGLAEIRIADRLAGPTDQPRISRSTLVYSQETLWYTGNEEGEQDLHELGLPAVS